MNTLGYPTTMMFMERDAKGGQKIGFGTQQMVNPALRTPVQAKCPLEYLQSAIVIYPESIAGNPLQARRVIRYYLNKEAYFPGDPKVNEEKSDFIVAFHRMFYPAAQFVLTQVNFNPVFNSIGTRPLNERSLKLTYVGKGDFDGPTSVIKDTVLIPRNWPPDQGQLALLLKNTSLIFSWDPMTGLLTEAVLCGAMPVILRYGRWKREDLDSTEFGKLPRLDMQDGGFEVDLAKFQSEKAALEANIQRIAASSTLRIRECIEKALAHFGA